MADANSSKTIFTYAVARGHLDGIYSFLTELINGLNRALREAPDSASLQVARSHFMQIRATLDPVAATLEANPADDDATGIRSLRVFRVALVALTEFLDPSMDLLIRRVEQLDLLGEPISALEVALRHHATDYQLAALRNHIECLAGIRVHEPDFGSQVRQLEDDDFDLTPVGLVTRRSGGVRYVIR